MHDKINHIPTIIYATSAPAGPAWATEDPLERKIPVPMVPPTATKLGPTISSER